MRNFLNAILFLTLAGLCQIMISCTAGSCLDETESRVKATFYSDSTGQPLTPDSVTLYGITMDTLKIYDKTEKLKSAEFPLFAARPECKFVIRINGTDDTIEFRYTSYPHIISKECGYTFYYDLDTVIHSFHIIKSISVDKKNITTLNEENMRIFY
jgi:hypothetical protein